MPVEVGKTYLFLTHAYYLHVAEVVEITGKREADVRNVVRVQPTNRDWEDLFGHGFRQADEFKRFPDGGLSWVNYYVWNHENPGERNGEAYRRK